MESENSNRLVCICYGLSIVSVTYIYKYFIKNLIFKKKVKKEDEDYRLTVDGMSIEQEISYFAQKEGKKDNAKSLIAFIITMILTIITFAAYCKKASIFDYLVANGFHSNLLKEIANVAMTLFLNSILFAVVIYKKYLKNGFKDIMSVFTNPSQFKSVIVAPLVEEWIFKVLFSIILGQSNSFNIQWFSPLVFSLCHFQLIFFFRSKYGWVGGLLKAFGLSVMTFVFGIYSSFIFLHTNSFLSSFLLHSYCNFLGPPSFGSKQEIGFNLACVISFFVLMNYMPFIKE